jgi:hypothetical protein
MAKKAILFGGTDGHGAVMTVISERNLRSEGWEVTTHCKYVVTQKAQAWEDLPADCGTGQPKLFWGQTFPRWDFSGLGEGDLVVVVDIPLPVSEGPQTFLADTAERGLAVIARLVQAGVRVVIVDHHKISETLYGRARDLGAEVIVASSAMTTHYGEHDEFAERWGRIGAVVDRDPSVLPVSEEEELLADGLDGAVKRQVGKFPDLQDVGLQETLQVFRRGDEEEIKQYLLKHVGTVPEPERLEVQGNVVYVGTLEPRFGFKQLDLACRRTGKPYGVGLNLSRGGAVVVVTYWKAQALPAALKLGLTSFIGHPSAPVIPVFSTGQPATPEEAAATEAKAREIIERLNAEEPQGPNGGAGNSGAGGLYAHVARFLRAVRIPFFLTEHGWGHVERVCGHARTLGSLFNLSECEQRVLDWAAVLHDVGNGARSVYPSEVATDEEARARHHEFSARMVREWGAQGLFEGILSPQEVELVARLCHGHRKAVPLPEDRDERFLTVLLRVADGIDIDARRAQRNDQGIFFQEIWDLPPDSRPHWEGHRAIAALRLLATRPRLVFEVLVDEARREAAVFQVEQLLAELAPLTEFADWKVEVRGAKVLRPEKEV